LVGVSPGTDRPGGDRRENQWNINEDISTQGIPPRKQNLATDNPILTPKSFKINLIVLVVL
jgi:hypothetical protein